MSIYYAVFRFSMQFTLFHIKVKQWIVLLGFNVSVVRFKKKCKLEHSKSNFLNFDEHTIESCDVLEHTIESCDVLEHTLESCDVLEHTYRILWWSRKYWSPGVWLDLYRIQITQIYIVNKWTKLMSMSVRKVQIFAVYKYYT